MCSMCIGILFLYVNMCMAKPINNTYIPAEDVSESFDCYSKKQVIVTGIVSSIVSIVIFCIVLFIYYLIKRYQIKKQQYKLRTFADPVFYDGKTFDFDEKKDNSYDNELYDEVYDY